MTKLDTLMIIIAVFAIALKLTGVIDIHWLLVLLPVWGWAIVKPMVDQNLSKGEELE